MNVYIGTSGELKNDYIGEFVPYTPGANTLAYFPFKEDGLDKTGNYTLTNTGTQSSIGRSFTSTSNFNTNIPATCKMCMCWINVASAGTVDSNSYLQVFNACGGSIGGQCFNVFAQKENLTNSLQYFDSGGSNHYTSKLFNIGSGWHHIVLGYDGSSVIYYVDGIRTVWYTGGVKDWGIQRGLIVKNSAYTSSFNIILSDLIIESRYWSDSEVTNYYNNTKSNYGL